MSPAVIKGAVLIFVALVLGVVLLSKGVDTNTSAAPAGTPTTLSPTTTPGGSSTSAPTTTSHGSRPPADVTVMVANASGVPGAAAKVSDKLKAKGYVTTEPGNSSKPASTTAVYYVGKDQPEAVAVAQALGVPASAVAAMPDPAPVTDLRGATVVVNLGPDQVPST
jgi:hypothetical protein